MECCIDFIKGVLSRYEAQNIIAVFALIFAYLAYRKSIVDGYKGWIDLAKSFRAELEYARSWIGASYNNTCDKDWSNPGKIVYPITADTAKAIIQKGHPPKGLFSGDFLKWIVRYNERVLAFNEMLKSQKMNYVLAQFCNSEKNNFDEQSKEKAKNINKIIHNKLIGNNGDESSLHSCYQYFSSELKNIEDRLVKITPWYFQYPIFVVGFFVLFYFILDYAL